MTQDELNVILEKHQKWLNDEDDGERADLSNAELEDKIKRGTLVELPDRVWIVEKTAFGGYEITEYVISECTYSYKELESIVINNMYTHNYLLNMKEYSKYHHNAFLCFSYKNALNKLKELRGKE